MVKAALTVTARKTTLNLPGGVALIRVSVCEPYCYRILRGTEVVLGWGARHFALQLLQDEIGYPRSEAEEYLAAVDQGRPPWPR
ncbi:hypothetical protein [Nocardiopsis composta]|uniref:Uncharacterized protein n=1 Tax=Nocardiopsis composta TaxID=157465 RepID=A0A7W8VCA8_9ACTN|nr:hypothetical protein [Nocardiopsis composta]MBB5431246.1 hypothetical protein [Nocardiopsis composta]